jgi:hypothetical protein
METVELRRIWNTLAEKKLIDKDLAKENILAIITKKGNGVIGKMMKKTKFDFWVNLFGVVFIPLLTLYATYYNNQHLLHTDSEMQRTYMILSLFELLMIYLLSKSITNLKYLKFSYNTGSLKESLIRVKSYFDSYLKKHHWVGLLSMYVLLSFVLIDTLIRIGGINQMNFSSGGSNQFESYFTLIVSILIVALPFISKLEIKKYAGVMRELEETIEELNGEN